MASPEPKQAEAEGPSVLCETPCPVNFSQFSPSKFGISTQSFIPSSSKSKDKSKLSKIKSLRRSSIGARGSPGTNSLILFMAQHRAKTPPVFKTPEAFKRSPFPIRVSSTLKLKMASFQSLMDVEEGEHCDPGAGPRQDLSDGGLDSDKENCSPRSVPSKRRRVGAPGLCVSEISGASSPILPHFSGQAHPEETSFEVPSTRTPPPSELAELVAVDLPAQRALSFPSSPSSSPLLEMKPFVVPSEANSTLKKNKKQVRFGGPLTPEFFDKNLPPSTPLQKGTTPARGEPPTPGLGPGSGLRSLLKTPQRPAGWTPLPQPAFCSPTFGASPTLSFSLQRGAQTPENDCEKIVFPSLEETDLPFLTDEDVLVVQPLDLNLAFQESLTDALSGGAAAAEPGAPPLEDPQAPPEEPPQAQLEGPGPEPETAVDAPASSDTPIKKLPTEKTEPVRRSSRSAAKSGCGKMQIVFPSLEETDLPFLTDEDVLVVQPLDLNLAFQESLTDALSGGAAAAEPGAPPLEDPQAPPEEPPQAQLEGPGPEPETAVDAPASSDTPIKKLPTEKTEPVRRSSRSAAKSGCGKMQIVFPSLEETDLPFLTDEDVLVVQPLDLNLAFQESLTDALSGGAAAAEPGAPPLEDPQAPPEEPPQAQLEGPGPEPETAVDAPASSDTPIKKLPTEKTEPVRRSSRSAAKSGCGKMQKDRGWGSKVVDRSLYGHREYASKNPALSPIREGLRGPSPSPSPQSPGSRRRSIVTGEDPSSPTSEPAITSLPPAHLTQKEDTTSSNTTTPPSDAPADAAIPDQEVSSSGRKKKRSSGPAKEPAQRRRRKVSVPVDAWLTEEPQEQPEAKVDGPGSSVAETISGNDDAQSGQPLVEGGEKAEEEQEPGSHTVDPAPTAPCPPSEGEALGGAGSREEETSALEPTREEAPVELAPWQMAFTLEDVFKRAPAKEQRSVRRSLRNQRNKEGHCGSGVSGLAWLPKISPESLGVTRRNARRKNQGRRSSTSLVLKTPLKH